MVPYLHGKQVYWTRPQTWHMDARLSSFPFLGSYCLHLGVCLGVLDLIPFAVHQCATHQHNKPALLGMLEQDGLA